VVLVGDDTFNQIHVVCLRPLGFGLMMANYMHLSATCVAWRKLASVLLNIISFHMISCHMISCHIVSCHVMSYHHCAAYQIKTSLNLTPALQSSGPTKRTYFRASKFKSFQCQSFASFPGSALSEIERFTPVTRISQGNPGTQRNLSPKQKV